MSELTHEFLNETWLLSNAGMSTFNRGRGYYLQKRVELITLENNHAHCHVRGSYEYCVDIWAEDQELYTECNCSYAGSGFFCKHMVAAGLFLHDHLRVNGASAWKQSLDRVVTVIKQFSARKPPAAYFLFFSLQKSYDTWSIKPLTLSAKAFPDVIWMPDTPPDEMGAINEIMEHNPWMVEKVKYPRQYIKPAGCVNCNPEIVAVANLIMRLEGVGPSYYHYSYTRSPEDFFQLVASTKAPLFYGTSAKPLQKTLEVLDQDGKLEIEMTRQNGEDVLLQVRINVGEMSLTLERENVQIISQSPLWIMTGGYLLRLSSTYTNELATVFLKSPRIKIPKSGATEFLEKYLIPIANHVHLKGEEVQWEIVEEEPARRLYLIEDQGQLQARLRFGYGEYEVSYDKTMPAT
ncbi:MAG: SNF2 helicase associated domain-containing protein, partial [Anaerolineales bacterium]